MNMAQDNGYVFDLPVFPDANIWGMWPAEKLNELAEDIKENGFDHRYPITIAEVNGEWMLLDGRNRRAAARIAGIIPPTIITEIDPKLAIHRSNNQNRDATPGQKAMAFAMQFPNDKRGRGALSFQNDNKPDRAEANLISKARFVLRHNPLAEGDEYPQRCRDIMAGSLSLTEAYDLTQQDVKRREEEERLRQVNAAKLEDIRRRYPDLAALVDDERLTLKDAIASAESRDREEAARLDEEERIQKQAAREEAERREARKSAWFNQFSLLLSSESLVANQAQIDLADEVKGMWDEFARKHSFEFKEARRRLLSLQKNIPALIEKFEAMKHE